MLKRWLTSVGLLVLLLLLAPAMPTQAATKALAAPAKEYGAEHFDQQITIQNDGTLLIKERVIFKFLGGPFTFVYREIPTDKTDGIIIQSAYMDEHLLPEGTDAGQVEITQSNPVKATWHFATTSDATHSFVLNYRVAGVVRKEKDGDALYWEALPTKYEYFIRSSTITVTYPEKAKAVGSPQVQHSAALIRTDRNTVIFLANNLSSSSPLEIDLRFASGSLISQAPQWQQRQAYGEKLIAPFLGSGIIVAILGICLLIVSYRGQRRTINFEIDAKACFSEPPDDLAPAMAGILVNPNTSWDQALATLFDLADRGVISFIVTADQQPWWSSFISGQEARYQLELRSRPAELATYERGLLSMLFPKPQSQTIALTKLAKVYKRKAQAFTRPLKQHMLERGFYDPQRQRFGKTLGAISVLCLLFSAIGIISSLIAGGTSGAWPIIFLALGLLLIAIVAWFLWLLYSRLSERGEQEARRWQAFSNYLTSISQGGQPVPSPTRFAQYLAYATSFGLLKGWLSAFQSQRRLLVPPWFRPLATALDEDDTTFLDMMVYTSMMNERSSSSGGSSGGGGGAAGGGSSGAG